MLNFKFIKEFDIDENLEALVYVNGVLDDYYDPLTKLYILADEDCDNYIFLKNDTKHRYFYDLSDNIKVLVRKKNVNLFDWGTLDGSEVIEFEN